MNAIEAHPRKSGSLTVSGLGFQNRGTEKKEKEKKKRRRKKNEREREKRIDGDLFLSG